MDIEQSENVSISMQWAVVYTKNAFFSQKLYKKFIHTSNYFWSIWEKLIEVCYFTIRNKQIDVLWTHIARFVSTYT